MLEKDDDAVHFKGQKYQKTTKTISCQIPKIPEVQTFKALLCSPES